MKKNVRRALGASLIAAAVVGVSGACSVTPEPDVMVLRYTGGSRDGSHFKSCLDGGKRGDGVVNDTDITLMTSERTWNITRKGQGGDSEDGIVVNTKKDASGNSGARVRVFLKVDFFLNTTCTQNKDGSWDKNSPVVKWWETVGRRYEADVDSGQTPAEQSKDTGWVNSLKANLVPVEQRAVQDSARQYTSDDLDTGANGSWEAMEKLVSDTLSKDLNANGGFYCGPGYDRTDPSKGCPPLRVNVTDIELADGNVAQQRADLTAAEIEAKARVTRANAALAEAKILAQINNNPNYVRIKELETQVQLAQIQLQIAQACAGGNGNCTIVQGGNGGVNVNAGQR